MEDESGPPPDSQLPYDTWMEESLRWVVLQALQYAADNGLPGAHHFYVTFRTDFPGVQLPARLLQKYPQEMTIVLQHQFRDLTVDKAARRFGVTLSFGGVSATLSVPLEAVSAFVDPSIQYGLRFKVEQAAAPPAPEPAPAPEAPPADPTTPQVVSLDAFRKRRD
ncbi:MAG TPA: ClpXP protease specificity-enhancing factor SspB [Acetobacteraceae bacterium]|nr:ClpXP protease specificity-enhancing factor SspB [Acetobacteraceae bacterium]